MTVQVRSLPPVGVMLLETRFARPPGDIGNAETFGGRVLFETVNAATVDQVLRGDPRDPALAESFRAARDLLVQRGAGIITTSCGLLVFQQDRLAQGCPVPFTASSLFQIPLRQRQHGKVGVLGLLEGSITPAHLAAAGVDAGTPVGALTDDAHLLSVLRTNDPAVPIDIPRAEAEVIEAGSNLVGRAPDIQAFVLECTNLPPYQAALSRELDLPVYGILDWLVAVHLGQALPDGGLPNAPSTGTPA